MSLRRSPRAGSWIPWAGLLAALALGAYLRFNQLTTTWIFSPDEAVSAFAMRSVLVEHHLRALLLGPPLTELSLPGPSFYYWLVAPAYLLMRGDPTASALTNAVVGLLAIPAAWLWTRRAFGEWPAAVAALFAAASPGMVALSRTGWNPDPMPALVLLTLLSLQRMQTGGRLMAVLAGVSAACMTQTHPSGLVLVPGMVAWLMLAPAIRRASVLVASGTFVALWTPWSVHDLVHRAPTFRAILALLLHRSSATAVATLSQTFTDAIFGAVSSAVGLSAGPAVGLLVFGVGSLVWLAFRGTAKADARLVLVCLVSAIPLYALVRNVLFFYYLLPLYPLTLLAISSIPLSAGSLARGLKAKRAQVLAGVTAALAAAALMPVVVTDALQADALPARDAPCGNANLRAVAAAAEGFLDDRSDPGAPYLLENWSPDRFFSRHDRQGNFDYMVQWLRGRPNFGASATQVVAFTQSVFPDADPRQGELSLLGLHPAATRLGEAGCFGVFTYSR
ncbi:MAG: glycosyltransferase family 39 protein [Candidatus Dormibacteria bacterium]